MPKETVFTNMGWAVGDTVLPTADGAQAQGKVLKFMDQATGETFTFPIEVQAAGEIASALRGVQVARVMPQNGRSSG